MTATTSNPALDVVNYQKTLADKSKSSSTSTASTSSGSSTLDKNSFMKLMVTQLKYQDPLNPSDNQQMAAQMAQFSSLEALQNMQTSLTDLGKTISAASAKQTSATEGMSTASATALLGQTARLKRASMGYTGAATDISVHGTKGSELQVLDSKGDVVRTLPLDGVDGSGKSILNSSGDGSVSWDGRDDSGKAVSNGTYSLSVVDSASGAETGYAFEQATITGVGSDSEGTVLTTASGSYRLGDLLQMDSSNVSKGTAGDSSAGAAAIALIGRTVRMRDSSGELDDKTGSVDWNFTAKPGAVGQIVDSAGKVVRTFSVGGVDDKGDEILASDGTGKFRWDGTDESGKTMSNGTYYLQILTSDGSATAGIAYQTVKVDQIGFDASGSPLVISGSHAWSYQNLYTVS